MWYEGHRPPAVTATPQYGDAQLRLIDESAQTLLNIDSTLFTKPYQRRVHLVDFLLLARNDRRTELGQFRISDRCFLAHQYCS